MHYQFAIQNSATGYSVSNGPGSEHGRRATKSWVSHRPWFHTSLGGSGGVSRLPSKVIRRCVYESTLFTRIYLKNQCVTYTSI